MFGKARVVVFDSILGGENEEMRMKLFDSLEELRDAKEYFYILEGALDAVTRKQVEKYAEKSEKFDAAKKEKDNSIFALANALQKSDKKNKRDVIIKESEEWVRHKMSQDSSRLRFY